MLSKAWLSVCILSIYGWIPVLNRWLVAFAVLTGDMIVVGLGVDKMHKNNKLESMKAPTRRQFLQQGSTAAVGMSLGVWLNTHWIDCLAAAEQASDAIQQQQDYQLLNPWQAANLDAISAQILPTTDTPGAREASVVNFFDQALSSHASFAVEPLNAWMTELDAAADKRQSGVVFHQLDDAAQQQILTEQQDSGGFGLMRFLTLVGMFAMSSYGGNKNNIGWELLGFNHQHAWQPPFGYYDAEYSKQQTGNGESA